MMQSNPSRLDTISQTIKKYNQALSYCYQGSYDLAIIQLKKVVSLNPKHVQGRQLLALLYLNNEQWEDARKELERCRKIDVNNTTTLRYLKEADAVLDIEEDFNAPVKKKSIADTITYHRGNETIIQPLNGRETKLSSTIVNMIVGIAIGIAVACLLILPARVSAASEESEARIKEIGEQLDEKNSTINSLEQEKNSLTARVEKLDTELATYTGEGGTISSMDNLLNAAMAYLSNPEDTATVAGYLDLIDEGFVDTSTETFRVVYDMLRTKIGGTVGSTYYDEGMHAYQNEQYDEAVENLSKAYAYDNTNVDALYNLANAYRKAGDNVNAIANYRTLVENFPDTELATRSQSFLNELVVE
jgi:tetratricopeptide (TPR) repeat protein